jgi:hypothetical protein
MIPGSNVHLLSEAARFLGPCYGGGATPITSQRRRGCMSRATMR